MYLSLKFFFFLCYFFNLIKFIFVRSEMHFHMLVLLSNVYFLFLKLKIILYIH